MFSTTDAQALIFTLAAPLSGVETLELADVPACLGRILAMAVSSPLDFPHWDNSAMDGYAVRASDVQQAPQTLQIVEEIAAGQQPQQTLEPGQAARILTGAILPAGADTVVMQEETTCPVPGQVTVLSAPKPGEFVRKQGSYARAGAILLHPGQKIGAAELALLAAAGQSQVQVYRRARVAILSTGSELVSPDQPLGPGQIVDSNQWALSALVHQAGAVPLPLGIVADQRQQVKAAIASALEQADWVISSGGVSVGDYDYVDAVLAELGATLHIRSVAVKPGKPLTVATLGDQLYFGLPGNPASAMVGFWRFIAPALAKFSGQRAPWGPDFTWAIAAQDLKAGGQRETYLWGNLTAGGQGYIFTPAQGDHQSGNLVNLVNINGLGVVPQGERAIAAGQPVRVLKVS